MGDGSSGANEKIVNCFNCTFQIQQNIHLKCAECPVFICIPCFQLGAEDGKHRRGHNYTIRDPFGSQVNGGGWGWLEESKLLIAAHRFKMGNWGEMIESMGSTRRTAAEAQSYFDKTFVRGWMGQVAIRDATDWSVTKQKMISDGSIKNLLLPNVESPERLLLILDALRDSEEQIDDDDSDIETKVQNILEEYVDNLVRIGVRANTEEASENPQNLLSEASDDELDPSDEEECGKGRKEGSDDNAGFEREVDSDEGGPSVVPVKKVFTKNLLVVDKRRQKELRRSDSKPPKISPVRKLTPKKRDKYVRSYRVRRDTSSDEDMEEDDSDEPPPILYEHGLEPEEVESSAGEDTEDSEEEEEVVVATPKASASRSRKMKSSARPKRKKKRATMSKMQRRLLEYNKKMARETKKMEAKWNACENICSVSEIKELRDAFPKLSLENNIPQTKSSAKHGNRDFRRDDLHLLAYNPDREEFEFESFNDAEQLISRLTLGEAPKEKDELLELENEIKFLRIQHYIRILNARRVRQRAIIEHDKITEFFNFMMSMTMEKRTATEVLADRPKIEALLTQTQQFLTRDEHKSFTEMIERYDALTESISRLQQLQRSGETTLKGYHPPSVLKKKKKLTKSELDFKKKAGARWKAYMRWQKNLYKEE